jgi:hypothetical protein
MTSKKRPARNYKRLMLGDVFEIPQYVNYHRNPPVWGHVIRVLPGVFRKRPEDFQELVRQPERFYAFFPAGPAVSRGYVRVVAHEEIPERCRNFPLFKATNAVGPASTKNWFLWDGEKEVKVDELLPEHYDLPLKEIIPFDVLVERIESGWSPRDEVLVEPPSPDVRRGEESEA